MRNHLVAKSIDQIRNKREIEEIVGLFPRQLSFILRKVDETKRYAATKVDTCVSWQVRPELKQSGYSGFQRISRDWFSRRSRGDRLDRLSRAKRPYVGRQKVSGKPCLWFTRSYLLFSLELDRPFLRLVPPFFVISIRGHARSSNFYQLCDQTRNFLAPTTLQILQLSKLFAFFAIMRLQRSRHRTFSTSFLSLSFAVSRIPTIDETAGTKIEKKKKDKGGKAKRDVNKM